MQAAKKCELFSCFSFFRDSFFVQSSGRLFSRPGDFSTVTETLFLGILFTEILSVVKINALVDREMIAGRDGYCFYCQYPSQQSYAIAYF